MTTSDKPKPDLHAIAREVAHQLGAASDGGAWTVDQRGERYDQSYYLNGAGHERLYLTIPYGTTDRVTVSGSLHVGRNGAYEEVRENGKRLTVPDISIAIARGAGVIAREIARRLLPEYKRILALALAQRARHDDYIAKNHARLKRLAAVAGVELKKLDDDTRQFYGPRHSGIDTVEVYSDSIRLKLDVSTEQAEKIIRLLCADAEAITTLRAIREVQQ